MGRKSLIKKVKQAARRETRIRMKAIEYDVAIRLILKPKPWYVPKWVFRAVYRIVIKKDDAKNKENTGKEKEGNG